MKTSHLIVLLFLALIWGSSFILIKKALIAFSPIQVAAVRVFVAGISLALLGYARIKEIPRDRWKYVAVVGFIGSFIPAFCFAYAQTVVPSAIAACLNSLVPLYVFLLGMTFFGQAFNWSKMLGVLLGLSGAFMLINFSDAGSSENYYWFALLIVLAGCMYAFSANTIKTHCSEINPISLTLGSFSLISPPALLLFLVSLTWNNPINSDQFYLSCSSIVGLGVFSTALGSLLYFKLTQQTNALFASTVTYLIPVIALFWGVLDGETFTVLQIAAFLLIISAVYLVGKKQKATSKNPIEN